MCLWAPPSWQPTRQLAMTQRPHSMAWRTAPAAAAAGAARASTAAVEVRAWTALKVGLGYNWGKMHLAEEETGTGASCTERLCMQLKQGPGWASRGTFAAGVLASPLPPLMDSCLPSLHSGRTPHGCTCTCATPPSPAFAIPRVTPSTPSTPPCPTPRCPAPPHHTQSPTSFCCCPLAVPCSGGRGCSQGRPATAGWRQQRPGQQHGSGRAPVGRPLRHAGGAVVQALAQREAL